MKPVRNLFCAGCKTHWFVGYDGEADELYCAECAQRKAMGLFGFRENDDPAILPTFMFENVLDEMDRLMGREVKPRPRNWAKPKLAPPPTTEYRSRPGAAYDASMLVFVVVLVSLGFLLGWMTRGGV